MALRDRGGDDPINIKIELSGEEEINELERALESANKTIGELNSEIDTLKEKIASTGVEALEERINDLERTARRAADAFLSVMKSVNIAFVDDNGITQFSSAFAEELYNGIRAGEKTFHAAISEFKMYMPEAFQQVGESVNAAFDQDVVINFTNSLNEMQGTLTQVFDLLQKIDTEGVKATSVTGGAGAGGDMTAALEHMKETAAGMDGELRGAYESITKLVEALTSYASIDAGNLSSVSAAFRNLVELGHTTFSGKKADNIISFASRLKDLSANGSVNFNIKGLDSLKGQSKNAETLIKILDALKGADATALRNMRNVNFEGFKSLEGLKVSSASLKALAENLPKLCSKDVSPTKLAKLNDIDLSKFNGLSIREPSLRNLATYLPQIAKANMDRLSKLQSFNFDNFNNIHINRGSIQTINDLVAAMTSFVTTASRLRDGGGFNTEYMLGNIARVARQGRELLNNNMEAQGHVSYDKLADSVTTLEEILLNCAGDADQLNDVLEQMGVSAPDLINTATSAMSTLRKEMQDTGEEGTTTVRQLSDMAASMQKSLDAAAKQDPNMKNTQAYREMERVMNLTNQAILDATQNGTGLREALRKVGLDGATVMDQAKDATAALNHELAETKNNMRGDKVQMHIDTGDLQQKIDAIRTSFSALTTQNAFGGKLQANVNELERLFTTISTSTDIDEKNAAYQRFNDLLSITAKQIRDVANAEAQETARSKAREDLIRSTTSLQERLNLMTDKFKESQKNDRNPMWKQLQADMKVVEDILEKLSNTNISPADIEKCKKDFKDVSANASSLEKNLNRGKGAIAGYFASFLSGSRIIMAVIRQIRQMINMAIELDKEMTQLQIVTRSSNAEMSKFSDTIMETSQRIAISAKDLISATTTFARLGYTMEESTKLAEITGMLQNVGDIEAGAAQNAITAIVKAFNVDVKDIESVADKLVVVGNNFPISVSQIAEGMNNASSALAAAGNTFDQSVALLTAANTVVQNASKSSTGLRTIAARLRNTTTDLEELGEEMTDAKYDELVKQLTDLSVSLTDVNGEYRSTYDILKDIAAKWEDLSSMEQSALATAIAGTRQQAIFFSIIDQFKEASGAMDEMANSAGELESAYSVYMDSIEAHINKFKTAFQELSQDVVTRDLINSVIDLGVQLLEFVKTLSKVIDSLGGLQVILPTIIGAFTSNKLLSGLGGIATKLGEASANGLGFTGALGSLGGAMSSLMSPIGAVSIAIGALIAIISAYNQAVEKKRQAALEDARSYDESVKKADEFKKKISELKSVLDDATTSHDDATRAREDLLKLQGEIESFYGMETGSLDLVAKGAREAADAIDKETQAMARQNLLDNQDAYRRATSEIEQTRTIRDPRSTVSNIGSTPHDLTLQSAVRDIIGQSGSINLHNGWFGTSVSFKGTAQEIVDDVTTVTDALRDLMDGKYRRDTAAQEYIQEFIDALSYGYTKSKEIIDEWQETYDSFIVNTVGADNAYSGVENSIKELASGAEEVLTAEYSSVNERNAALDEYKKKLADAQSLLDGTYFKNGDQRIKRYFQDSIDAVEEGIEAGYDAAWEGIEKLKGGLSDAVDSLKEFDTAPIDTLKESISTLKTAFDNFADGKTYSAISAIQEKFGDVSGIDDYISRLLDAGTESEKLAEIMNELVAEKLQDMAATGELAGADERLVAAMLKEAGVANSDEAAHEALAVAKAQVEAKSIIAERGIDGLIESLKDETKYTDLARKEMLRFAMQMVETNNTGLDLSGQIEQLFAIANAAGVAAASLAALRSAGSVGATKTRQEIDMNARDQFGNPINVDVPDNALLTEQEVYDSLRKKIAEATKSAANFSFSGDGGGGGSKGGGGGGGSSVEKYIADIDRFYEALKQVEAIEQRISTLQSRIDTSEDTDERIELTKQLINSYKEEATAMEELNRQRSEGIQGAISDLQNLGFVISYNAETHELLVQNMEHLNELEAGSTEATNELRKETEELIKDMESWNSANQQTEASLRGVTSNIREARDAMVDYLEQAVSRANEMVDGLQNVYDTLTNAAKEYAENGFLSVDSLQAILALGPKYMDFLVDENGQLVINEENLQRLIAARTEEMAAETALSYAKQILLATETGEIETLIQLTQVDIAASNATWDMAYATLGLAKAIGTANGIQASYYDDAFEYIKKMQSVTKTAVNSISSYYETLNDDYVSQKDALDQILKATQDMIKWENEQQIKGLEQAKKNYDDIIDQKKELIQLAKEQAEREKSVQDKLADIAKLQAKIAQLSLDDSREAQAQKSKLEEELAELQKSLADEQAGYSTDAQISALDKQKEAFDNSMDQQIEGLRNMLQSAEQLYQAAIGRIEGGWNSLYGDLMDWNYNYGNTLQKDLVNAWDAASAAVQRYGSFVAALEGTAGHTGMGEYDNNPPGSDSYTNYDGSSQANESIAKSIVARMKANSNKWTGSDAAGRDALAAENERLGAELAQLLGANVYRDQNGVWWINGQRLYDVYHKGGIVGNSPTRQQDEVMALLQKGEAVLDSQREKGLYKIVDFVSLLSQKLGSALDSGQIGRVFGSGVGAQSIVGKMAALATPQLADTGAYRIDKIEVSAPVYVTEKLTEDDIRKHAEIIGSVSAKYIEDGFVKRGVRKRAALA